ncbi:hypothetical protein KSF78_0003857 [Schistosoma japonicum]|nr:hypothetical protein KSF78_0003857 [Schistosoma japonicum]
MFTNDGISIVIFIVSSSD